MFDDPPARIRQHIAASLGDGFAAPLALVAVLWMLILRGIWLLPDGYDGEGGLTAILLILFFGWLTGSLIRGLRPGSRIGTALTTFCLYMGLCFSASLAAAASAIGGSEYIDPWLARIDATLFPFYDWKAVALALPGHPLLYDVLNVSYNTMGWQPLLLICLACWAGQPRDLAVFVTAWGVGLVMCILPFHWLPAVSPMVFHGITPGDLPNHQTGLPWDFLPVMEGMRDGTIRAIGTQCLTGMITMPSFHAGGAVILAIAFWRYRIARWPMLLVNVLMALSAVPIGSHYIIDVVVGSAVGALAMIFASFLLRHHPAALPAPKLPRAPASGHGWLTPTGRLTA